MKKAAAKAAAKAAKKINYTKERDRTGKPKLTAVSRIKLLNEIYDGLLYTWKEQVVRGWNKGTGAIGYQLERARLEIEYLAKDCSASPEEFKELVGPVTWMDRPEELKSEDKIAEA